MLPDFMKCLAVMGTAMVCLAPWGAPQTTKSADRDDAWPMFRGNSALWGISDTNLPPQLKLRWTFQAKDSIESSASIVGETVYVGSMDGNLYAVDLASGKIRWQYKTVGPIEESSPCVSNGTVYVGDLNGIMHAVESGTGKARWTFKAGDEIKSSPNVVSDRVYFGSYDQSLYCLSAGTGAFLWSQKTDGPVHCTPAVDKGRVYISGCDENFRAFDAVTGRPLYAMALGAYAGASSAVRDDEAFIGTFGNEVLNFDLARRMVRWTYRHATRHFPFYSSAAIAGDCVVLGGRDKLIHCLSRRTGKAIWTFLTRARVESSPLVVGNRVFAGSNDGVLYELDLVTGKKVWDFTAGAPLSASAAAAKGALVIGSQDGVIYCFGN